MKTCAEFKENISLYIDDELTADERRAFEEHLGSCPECKSEYDEIMHIVGLCRDVQDVELPDNFREELHRKLLDAAAESVSENTARRRTKYVRIFSSIAAGFVLIFLFSGIYRFGFSPRLKGNNSTGSLMMKSAAAQGAPADTEAAALETTAGAADEYSADIQFGTAATLANSPTIAGQTTEAGRSDAKNRSSQAPMAAYSKSVETVYIKAATFTVLADDPGVQAEKVKTVAGSTEGEERPNTASGGDIVLTFSIPDNRYDEFTKSLNSTFGQDVKQGEMKSVDRTADLGSLVDESNTIDTEIKKLKDADSAANAEEINELKTQQQKVQSCIEDIRLSSDFTIVTITIRKK